MSDYDPARARTKRPLPLWVDAFIRDTQTLEPDEVGAYLRILMAMWSTPSLVLPDDPRRLARAAGVSTKMWNARIGPMVRPLLKTVPGGVSSKRLRQEADALEAFLRTQSDRRKGVTNKQRRQIWEGISPPKSGRGGERKPLEYNDRPSTADVSADTTIPTSQHKRTPDDDARDAREPPEKPAKSKDDPFFDAIREAACVDPSKNSRDEWTDVHLTPEVLRWRSLGLTDDEIVAVIRGVQRKRGQAPPNGPRYFTRAMQDLAGEKARPDLEPTPKGEANVRPSTRSPREQRAQQRLSSNLAFAKGLDGSR